MSEYVIAIDGPSASGKSTVSRAVARRLGCVHVDSGSLYRALTWMFAGRKALVTDPEVVSVILREINISFFARDGKVGFSIDGMKPDEELRSMAVNEKVSLVAALPAVREWVVGKLRAMTVFGSIVMEGRDIGTSVFPEAQFKFYLDATPEERAHRRYREMKRNGAQVKYEDVLRSIRNRDSIDSSRSVAPLKTAEDAVVIQTTTLSVDAVVDLIVTRVRGSRPGNGR